MGRLLRLILGSLVLASSAAADWQPTRWGMTPEETAAALHGEVVPSTLPLNAPGIPAGATVLLDFTQRVSGWPADGLLVFDDAGLAAVRLQFKGGVELCWKGIYAALLDERGEPADSGTESFGNGITTGGYRNWAQWPATAEGDAVETSVWEVVGSATVQCTVTYRRP